MDRPAKPRPDYPLFPHATGRWAKKINGKLHYFGPWSDPEAAEDNYNRQKAELKQDRKQKHKPGKIRRCKPPKPRPDYPLYPHPSGQWACRVGQETKYFGPWDNPEGAEEAYKTYTDNKSTRPAPDNKPGKDGKSPKKPRKNFPLWPHPTGQWAKKINGTTYYFGRWADPDAAEEKYLRERDDLLAGRVPRDREKSGETIGGLCKKFLEHKRSFLATKEISQRSVDDYDRICAKISVHFGEHRRVDDLTPEDLGRFRALLAENYGAVRLANEIIRARCVFKFAFDWGLIPSPVRYGGAFSKPKAAVLRRERQKKGKRLFTPDQICAMLKVANKPLKAMILLGINCGFGNEDCATLPLEVIDLKRGWIDYARPKTAVERACPLWHETLVALTDCLAERAKPATDEYEGLVFLTKSGLSWSDETHRNPITKETAKLLVKLGIKRPGLSFYALRHTFYTVSEYCKDKDALEYIMGHAADGTDMRPFYREATWISRLRSIVEHVHRWVFEPGYAEKVTGSR